MKTTLTLILVLSSWVVNGATVMNKPKKTPPAEVPPGGIVITPTQVAPTVVAPVKQARPGAAATGDNSEVESVIFTDPNRNGSLKQPQQPPQPVQVQPTPNPKTPPQPQQPGIRKETRSQQGPADGRNAGGGVSSFFGFYDNVEKNADQFITPTRRVIELDIKDLDPKLYPNIPKKGEPVALVLEYVDYSSDDWKHAGRGQPFYRFPAVAFNGKTVRGELPLAAYQSLVKHLKGNMVAYLNVQLENDLLIVGKAAREDRPRVLITGVPANQDDLHMDIRCERPILFTDYHGTLDNKRECVQKVFNNLVKEDVTLVVVSTMGTSLRSEILRMGFSRPERVLILDKYPGVSGTKATEKAMRILGSFQNSGACFLGMVSESEHEEGETAKMIGMSYFKMSTPQWGGGGNNGLGDNDGWSWGWGSGSGSSKNSGAQQPITIQRRIEIPSANGGTGEIIIHGDEPALETQQPQRPPPPKVKNDKESDDWCELETKLQQHLNELRGR